jgi:membrane-bound lytic murein transglycosylase D
MNFELLLRGPWRSAVLLGAVITLSSVSAPAFSDADELSGKVPFPRGLCAKSMPLEEIIDHLDSPDSIYLERTLDFQFDFPLSYHPRINFYLDYFTHQGRPVMERWLARSGRYEEMIRVRLRSEGLPEDFFFLALIESGFNPYARSRAGAGGIWQFMPYTGRIYGLNITYWADERRDPEKSTEAAIRYLKALYARFGDWTLAAASYNAGEGRIQRAIERTDTEDYWEMIDHTYLKLETRDYIPRMIAAAIICKNPGAFGFDGIQKEKPVHIETVTVPDATDLRVIASLCGSTFQEIKFLNPALLRWCTPPGQEFQVNVPAGKAEAFKTAYQNLPPEDRITFRRHVVGEGETLSVIAERYHTSIYPIMQMNGIRNKHRIIAGASLIIPVPLDRAPAVQRPKYAKARHRNIPSRPARPEKEDLDKKGLKGYTYVIQEDDTLWEISQRAGVNATEVKRWNNIRFHRSLKPGQEIVLYLPEDKARIIMNKLNRAHASLYGPPRPGQEITYTVRRGDNLWAIARRYSLRTSEIIAWNKLQPDTVIQPGDQLRIILPDE